MFWAAVFISPVRDKTGDVVQHFVSFVDLTKHKQEKDRLRFLLDELNHRTQKLSSLPVAPNAKTRHGRRASAGGPLPRRAGEHAVIPRGVEGVPPGHSNMSPDSQTLSL